MKTILAILVLSSILATVHCSTSQDISDLFQAWKRLHNKHYDHLEIEEFRL
jgi:hypothetical protein